MHKKSLIFISDKCSLCLQNTKTDHFWAKVANTRLIYEHKMLICADKILFSVHKTLIYINTMLTCVYKLLICVLKMLMCLQNVNCVCKILICNHKILIRAHQMLICVYRLLIYWMCHKMLICFQNANSVKILICIHKMLFYLLQDHLKVLQQTELQHDRQNEKTTHSYFVHHRWTELQNIPLLRCSLKLCQCPRYPPPPTPCSVVNHLQCRPPHSCLLPVIPCLCF